MWWKSKTVLLSKPNDFAFSEILKNVRLWSLERTIALAEMHERLTTFSGAVIRTRSRMLLCLVGYMLLDGGKNQT